MDDNEYKKFFDETPVAFVRTDIDTGEFILANPFCAKLLGFNSVDELMEHGSSIDMYCDPGTRNKLIKKLRKGNLTNVEVNLTTRDGRKIWINASLHINCGGTCVEGSLTDITESKAMQAELETLKKQHLTKMCSINQKLEKVMQGYSN